MDFPRLKSELIEDPQSRGYSDKSPTEQAILINSNYKNVIRPITMAELVIWLIGVDGFYKLQSIQMGHPAYSLAYGFLSIVGNPQIEKLHLDDIRVAQMADALVGLGVFTIEEKNSLFAMATTQTSRANELGLGEVSEGHISEALGGTY